jgi:hypothetical protein
MAIDINNGDLKTAYGDMRKGQTGYVEVDEITY